ncbi:hypothetical protein [Aliidiomarina maris]|uniref:Uncharacterized protein n=1 Tax=Aliidiomarina maris TaxID=531312 RepID=A0A327WV27_9GAMM|nr:hypothetical protein [Aliidiomarina maris]MBA3988310.1 hypothetical protein [Idiomarina sp.]MCL5049490.1 hypothetical protein [Bacillota bacterium]RAJ96886.1 hypothetical protein B0I24_10797 [Aliidiomarina maris]RUO24176.1 hypothetical protein CWE07_08795 [Aliidiomarina maris]
MDIDKVVQSPADYFASPAQVATEPALNTAQKIKVLESWQVDANRLLTSDAENMPGDEHEQITAQLQEISSTLNDLKSAAG